MQESGKTNNNSKSKGNGKGKGKANAGNHVRDGSPMRELLSSRHATDPWDDLRNAWAVEFSQSKQRGQGTQHNHDHDHSHSQQQRQQKQHQNRNNNHQNNNQHNNNQHNNNQHNNNNHNNNHHPNGQQSGSASAQNRRGRGGGGGQVHAGQKRRATESVTNGTTGADDGDRGHAPKRHKSERRPPPPPSRSSPDHEPNPDSSGAGARPHPDFWYPDGSVIIQVEKTKFKLHLSMLQKHSGYFADALGKKGSHKRGGRTYLEVEVDERSPNGHHLPVYRVGETTADDFATLLTMVEGPTMCVLCYRCFFLLRHVG